MTPDEEDLPGQWSDGRIRYVKDRAAGRCVRCHSAQADTGAHCARCREKNRARFKAARDANRARYNARMRAWKAQQKAA